MKKIIFLMLLVTASHFCFSEVTGYAFLVGQTDHSGIKVKFIPNSPTAVLDSTYSIADGSYSILLEPGVYYVTFSKPGYETIQYNDGDPVVITANYILSDVTLQGGGNIVYLAGNVNGILTSENIYIVTDDVTVPELQMLYIESGTIIKLQENCYINVYGVLKAIGTSQENIVFTSAEDNPGIGDWGSLRFYYSAYDTCFLKHCVIEFGNGISVEAVTIIENCELRHLVTPIGSYIGDYSCFINNKIHDFTSIGINVNNTWYLTIQNNEIDLNAQPTGDYFTGIQCFGGSNGIIEGNKIHCFNSQLTQTIEGIYSASCNWQIYNNIVDNCHYGLRCFDNSYIIVNNIFSNNTEVGVYVNGSDFSSCIIQSNIIYGNAIGFESNYGASDINFSNNNVWDNIINYDADIPGIGQIITINNNGDPCDPYFNITLDPMFVDATNMDFHVNEGSPVIDAGSNTNINFLFDLDGYPRIMDGNNNGVAIVDMGVYEFMDSLIMVSDFTCPDSACSGTSVTIEYLGTPIGAPTYHWDFDGGNAVGSGPGPYEVYWQEPGLKTISLYLSFSIFYSDTTYHNILVGQTDASSVSISASSNPICTGDEVTFTAFPVNGGETPFYQWKLNGQNVGTNSPVYTNSSLVAGNMIYCYLTSSEDCIIPPIVQSNIIYMGVHQYPEVTIASYPNDTACISEVITLNAGNPGCTYEWSTGQTTQSIVVTNTSGPSGGLQDYSVVVTKGGICSDYDTISVYFDPCTGLNEINPESKIKIFPNPASEVLYIRINEIIYLLDITIITLQGIKLEEFKIKPSEARSIYEIDLAKYPEGIYLIRFQNEKIFEIKTLIKN